MFSYMGGKKFQSKWISSFFPDDITTYVEPFGGAFWVYLKGMPTRAKQVVYNDLNPLNANFFECATTDSNKLNFILKSIPPQNAELFIEFRDNLFDENGIKDIVIPDYDVASNYAYLITQVFSGNTLGPKTKMTSLKGKYRSKYEQLIDKFNDPSYNERLKGVTHVCNLPFEKVIEEFDSPTTLFYCDPPYYNLEKYYTEDRCDHEMLAKMLNKIQGLYVLSYYHFNKVDEWYPASKTTHIYKTFNKQNGNRMKRNSSKGDELLILNYSTGVMDFMIND